MSRLDKHHNPFFSYFIGGLLLLWLFRLNKHYNPFFSYFFEK